ncbi:membrane protein insertase YidC [Thermaerobacter sp. PB12/4term]|uniref:YidC/Oxa1 family membrane protein insertase n=1 Tax=Thermaerobacter sp. PB12/4term TaxID=2293838 RepID=UPI000E327765|nr:YidC/Oxa1 family membrane protein insertase [Thermaerobacter sp. PB12/4term]QIA28119.1 membrane protein insertase YidC [Thermaerobacter sp. PB12/4term]
MSQLWQWFVDLIEAGLELSRSATGSAGLSIILFTVLVRLVLLPLTFSQMRSMQRMQALQPEVERIQKKYKNNPQKANEAIMQLWRENNVNPAAGCLPLLIQFPILYALFIAFRDFSIGSFLWIPDLGKPDPWFVLPILAGVTTYFQMKTSMTSVQPQQRTMLVLMPAMLTFFAWSFPAGLALYWVTSNIFSIVQQVLMNRRPAPAPAGKGKAGHERGVS